MTLIASLRLAGLPVRSVCGGNKACGTCRVRVDPDWFARLPSADKVESNLLNCLKQRSETDRLACQIPINPSLEGLVVHLGR
jgi:CDP-4-dehydro-6-deoxyglucose reductase